MALETEGWEEKSLSAAVRKLPVVATDTKTRRSRKNGSGNSLCESLMVGVIAGPT